MEVLEKKIAGSILGKAIIYTPIPRRCLFSTKMQMIVEVQGHNHATDQKNQHYKHMQVLVWMDIIRYL